MWPYSGWQDALELQMLLAQEAANTVFENPTEEDLAEHEQEMETLTEAEPMFVSGDVTRLVTAATEGFGREPLLPSDIAIPAGFALLGDVFPDRVGLTDADYARADEAEARGDHEEAADIRKEPEADYACGAMVWRTYDDGVVVAFFERWEPRQQQPPLRLYRQIRWEWGEPQPELMGEERTQPGEHGLFASWEREIGPVVDRPGAAWFQVLMRLSQQRIMAAERARVPRATRRRAARAGFPGDEVLVVKLRRQASRRAGGESSVDWSCRWTVHGHWRNQWYPSLGQHRQMWIAPYVKGPEDKDLRVTVRAYEFRR